MNLSLKSILPSAISPIAFTVLILLSAFSLEAQQAGSSRQGEYARCISDADGFYNAKDWANALYEYNRAARIDPVQAYPKQKTEQIRALFEKDPALQPALFEEVILKGESKLSAKDYPGAKRQFETALELDPSSQYAKDKLSLIRQSYSDPLDAARYADAMARGDEQAAKGNFDDAVNCYNIALTANPDARQPRDKILQTNKLKAENAAKKEQYGKLAASADKLLSEEKRDEAKVLYEQASALLPGEPYARQKISEIEAWYSTKKALQDSYDRTIDLADQFYLNRDFVNARIKYQEAISIKPAARYPKDMLEKCGAGLAQLSTDKEKYDAAIALADNLLSKGNTEGALEGYRSASALMPGETYPKTKIAEIEKSISERNSRQEAYAIAIQNGDQAAGEKKFDQALSHYRNALTLLPDEKYPAEKITEINGLIAAQKNTEAGYAASVKAGDSKLALKKYQEAILSYREASDLKPSETYPLQKISEIDGILSSIQLNDEKYAASANRGDSLLNAGNLPEALRSFKEATALKPAEKYPKEKISAINALLAKQQSDQEKYDKAIASAEQALNSRNYTLALAGFRTAAAVKPAETYPAQKIAEINNLLADAKTRQENYDKAIARGTELLAAGAYQEALSAFSEASADKPEEKLPRQKAGEINAILSALREKGEQYTSLINSANSLLAAGKLGEALSAYQAATGIKPEEAYPKQKISEIEGQLAAARAQEEAFLAEIAGADKLFEAGRFTEAISGYKKALEIRPGEKYASERVAAAENSLADMRTKQENYDKAVAEGDRLMAEKNYSGAKNAYEAAIAFKPAETYPGKKIIEINLVLDGIKARDDSYSKAVAEGDNFFAATKYREALEPYERANTIKPGEKYPLDQIDRIKGIFEEQKKKDDEYSARIAEADKLLAGKSYEPAAEAYGQALRVKPGEKYPQEKIAAIQAILDGIKSVNEQVAKLISDGDISFVAKDYEKALPLYRQALALKPGETSAAEKATATETEIRKRDESFARAIGDGDTKLAAGQYQPAIDAYNAALSIKPGEKYPGQKIAEINDILTRIRQTREAYDKAMAGGDASFTAKRFEEALALFREASGLIPEEQAAKDKITAAESEIRKINDSYQAAVAEGDKRLAAKQYSEALNAYQSAQEIKPSENYPAEKISAIHKALEEEKAEMERLYSGYIGEGDRLFAAQDLVNARSAFTKAFGIKPSEQYPKDKLNDITAILLERSRAAKAEYDKIIVEADKLFQSKILDQALDAYARALNAKPDESYPELMIGKIRQYINDHAFVNLNSSAVSVSSGQEKKFTFSPIEPRLKKNNYILVRAKSSNPATLKVYLNYGRDAQKNGGVVLRNLSEKENDILVRISVQDKWYREDNNWISLSTEGGSVEVSRIDIAQGDE